MAMNYDDGSVDVVILGGTNPKSGKKNPTELTGYYARATTIKTKFGVKPLYVFDTASGAKGLIGSGNLNKIMESKTIGRLTHVIDTGERKDIGKGNPMKVFRVGQDDSDVADLSNFNPDTSSLDYSEDNTTEDQPEETQVLTRPTPPAASATVPSADRQARLQALLSKGR